jgi:hypothetical protein
MPGVAFHLAWCIIMISIVKDLWVAVEGQGPRLALIRESMRSLPEPLLLTASAHISIPAIAS